MNDKQIFKKAWQLNERHYGALTGLNKVEMGKKLGEEKLQKFRRSWDLRPDPLNKKSLFHPSNIGTYNDVPIENIPDTDIGIITDDSVIMTDAIYRRIENGESPLVAAYKGSKQISFKIEFGIC